MSRTTLPVVGAKPAGPAIDYELLLDCVHCGLCTASCPTYVETGHEADSPRGRIHLMRAVIDGRLELDADVKSHLDLCLNCRACESACPSGVQYGKLIEPFREYMAELEPGRAQKAMPFLQRSVVFNLFPSATLSRLALAPAKLMQWTGVDAALKATGLLYLLPKSLRDMHGMLPRLKSHYGSLPEILPAEGQKRARVALFLGCVSDAVYPQTNYATAKVLQKNGCEVWIPRNQGCCGALHYHSAMVPEAVNLAGVNCKAFDSDVDAIIVNAAGCGAMLKDYDHLLHNTPHAELGLKFQCKVKDVHEFLAELGVVPPTQEIKLKATYHDACHLCHAQQIRTPPRHILSQVPGLEIVPLPESELCCGAAGSYNLTQPQMAERLGRRKAENICSTGARAVFTGNVGCMLQIDKHLREVKPEVVVAHPMDVLWAAYGGHEAFTPPKA